MYERFTDRNRKVMQLANQEAQRFNHEYVGTEHILLGIVKEGDNVAAKVLKHLGVDLRKVRLEVEKLVQSGPDAVIMGKLPQTPRAKKVIEYAIEAARERNHNYVGTEHLLLGLLRESEGVASTVLANFGVTVDKVNATFGLELNSESSEQSQFERISKLMGFHFTKEQDVEDRCKSKLHQVCHVLLRYLFGAHSAEMALKKVTEIVEDAGSPE